MKYLGFADIGTNICIGFVHIDLFHLGVIGLQISQNPVNYFSHHPYFWKQKRVPWLCKLPMVTYVII